MSLNDKCTHQTHFHDHVRKKSYLFSQSHPFSDVTGNFWAIQKFSILQVSTIRNFQVRIAEGYGVCYITGRRLSFV